MTSVIIQVQIFFYNNLDHHFIYYIYVNTLIQQNSYIILLLVIILNTAYIKILIHISYSITKSENNIAIYVTIFFDFNNQSTLAITTSRHQSPTRPSVTQPPYPTTTLRRHPMSTSRHRSATTPSVIQATSATWMQPRHPTSTSRQRALHHHRWYRHLCLPLHLTEELFEAICDTADLIYVDTAETSNVSIEPEESDIAIEATVETSYVIFDDIKYSRVGRAMWRPADNHIERGCETSYLRDV